MLLAVVSGSFGEGVDLPGSELECIIIVGVPLAPPDLFTKSLINYYNESILYRNGRRAMSFYDKIKEIKKKETISEYFLNKNVLRYELKFNARLKEQLNMDSEITVSQLFEKKFYLNIVSLWQNYYFSIEKHHKLKLSMPNGCSSVNELIKQFALIGMKSAGGLPVAIGLLNNMKIKKQINRQQYYRQKKKLKSMYQNEKYIEKNECIKELDEKINEIALREIEIS